ncbi:hypothetical protein BLOT_010050 [Blomia tropicalis]|nr:hypothetical protein BLOT_010050 [Blomia tropicalis]
MNIINMNLPFWIGLNSNRIPFSVTDITIWGRRLSPVNELQFNSIVSMRLWEEEEEKKKKKEKKRIWQMHSLRVFVHVYEIDINQSIGVFDKQNQNRNQKINRQMVSNVGFKFIHWDSAKY